MILNQQRAVRLARRPLEHFLRRLQRELGFQESGVTIALVSDAEIARMNETFRKKEGPTDVLSFPTAARRRPRTLPRATSKQIAGEFLGDIAISPATARRYARNGALRQVLRNQAALASYFLGLPRARVAAWYRRRPAA
jgi:rRNA maturation RNase YbeY